MAYHVETHRLNLRRSQHAWLGDMGGMACHLYNAALEERIGNWRAGVLLATRRNLPSPHLLPPDVWRPVTLHTQFTALTLVRADDPDGYGALPTNVAREVLVRLDRAFKAFFMRVASGKGKPGFPRFKSIRRWRSFGWDEMNGVRVDGDRIRFELFGVKRSLRFLRHRDWPPGARSCAVRLVRKAGRWEAHIQIEYDLLGEVRAPKPVLAKKAQAAELFGDDVELAALWLRESRSVARRETKVEQARLAAVDAERRDALFQAALADGTARGWDANVANHVTNDQGLVFDNPRLGQAHRDHRSKVEQELARQRKGSKRRAKTVLRLRRLREREANARRTLAHQQSAEIVRRSPFNVFEDLDLAHMTRSAAGTSVEPGKNVVAKSGLNREMLDCAHGMRVGYVRYKAERAGGRTVTVPAAWTSRTCSRCGTRGSPDEDRMFRCAACGLDRDANAARNILARSRDGGVVVPGAKARQDRREVRSDRTATSNSDTTPRFPRPITRSAWPCAGSPGTWRAMRPSPSPDGSRPTIASAGSAPSPSPPPTRERSRS